METFTDDTVVTLASFLSPHDMLSLALTCRRFGDKHGTNMKRSAVREEGREVRQKIDAVSLMEVVARTVLYNKWTEEEKNALPRCEDESWIGLYHEFLKLFRLPLQFDKLVGQGIKYNIDSTNRTSVDSIDKARVVLVGYSQNSAICSNIMRAGRHSVSFNVDNSTGDGGITLGIMRPTTNDIAHLPTRCSPFSDLSRYSLKDYETLYGDNNVDCCLMDTWLGRSLTRRRWKRWKESELAAMDEEQREQAKMQNKCEVLEWEGEERIRENHFKIGFVLDLDAGTLDVYKNDRRFGTMKSGLVGEYCWVVSLFNIHMSDASDGLTSVTIGR